MSNITGPIRLMTAVIIGTAVIILVMIVFAGAVGNASVSTQVISTNTTLTNLLPWLGAMVAGGLVMVAIGGRR